MSQFDLRAAPDVPREQTDQRRLGLRRHRTMEFEHTRTGPADAFHNELLQPKNISREKSLKVFCRRLNVLHHEELAHERNVGPPGELESFGTVSHAKFTGESPGKRRRPGAPSVDQRAINIK